MEWSRHVFSIGPSDNYINDYPDATITFQPYKEEIGDNEETLVTPFILVISYRANETRP